MSPNGVRLASLLPAGTEIACGLGAEAELVGISHECDYPPGVQGLPRLTWSPVDPLRTGAEIDWQVRALSSAGQPVIAVRGDLLRQLAPTVILTQDLCDVCAVVEGDARALAGFLEPSPVIVPLRARTLAGILTDIRTVAAAIGRADAAEALIGDMENRLVRLARSAATPARRVVVIEWLDPLYLAGHWVPELVGWAGGRDVGATAGSHSTRREWSEVIALDPELVIVALCGFGVDRARAEWEGFLASGGEAAELARSLRAAVHVIDGNAFTSRPGPRVVDGAEMIGSVLGTVYHGRRGSSSGLT